MKDKEKQLLLVDLCGRLLYGVRIKLWYQVQNNNPLVLDEEGKIESLSTASQILHDIETGKIKDFKPYLRPMRSMTEEEKVEFESLGWRVDELDDNSPWNHKSYKVWNGIDWLSAHHFDYRGLIEKGLALEAPPNMYNITQ